MYDAPKEQGFHSALAQDAGQDAQELTYGKNGFLGNVKQGKTTELPELSDEDVLENKLFRSTLWKLALPIALQALISAAVNYADVLVLSSVNQEALSAVSLAGQVTFVLTLLYMGLSTGLCILATQYWGRRDIPIIEKALGMSVRLSAVVSVVFFLLTLLLPQALMRIFTPDEAVIAYGAPYLRTLSVSYLAMAVSQMLLAVMRSVEQTKTSAWISSLCLVVNIALNLLAVFALFAGNTMLCVVGVAAATVLARILELALCLRWSRRENAVRLRLAAVRATDGWLKKDFYACTVKVQLNYLVWGGALTAMSALIGHVSTDMVSAYSVANSVRNLAIVACTGLATGGGVLLGKQLGANKLALAKLTGQRLCSWSLGLGGLAGLTILLARPLCLSWFRLSPKATELLDGMLLVCALYCVGKAFNSTMVGGVFCAGGDTRFGLLCDVVAMWGVILPLGYLCAFVWKLPPIWVFVVLSLDELIKMPFVALHYRKGKWIRNLTRDAKEIETL